MTKEPMDDAHVLIADKLAETIPKLYETQEEADPVVRVKFFTPDSTWTWFVTEFDPENRLCFGFVIGLESEFGYFALSELEEACGPLGLKIERDLHFSPQPLSECMQRTR